MAISEGFKIFLLEALEPVGQVTARRMFGGAGLFHDGLMFALIANDVLYFKADEINQQTFIAEGCRPFSYSRAQKPAVVMSYWRAPERLLDDVDEMQAWAREAIAAAERNARPKKPASNAGRRAAKPARKRKAAVKTAARKRNK